MGTLWDEDIMGWGHYGMGTLWEDWDNEFINHVQKMVKLGGFLSRWMAGLR